MEFLPSLLTLAGMHILMAMLPGPNTVVITWLSATESRGAGLRATAGIVLASLVWVVLSLFGVGTLLLRSVWLGLGELAAGVVLGFLLIRRIGKDDLPPKPGPASAPAAAETRYAPVGGSPTP